MRRRGGLGRGLDALIPSSPQDDREPVAAAASQEPAVTEAPGESSGPSFEQLPLDREVQHLPDQLDVVVARRRREPLGLQVCVKSLDLLTAQLVQSQ